MTSGDCVLIEDAKEEYSELLSGELQRLDLLEEFRLKNLYCDFLIKAGSKRWNCHQNVLAATAPYFQTLFSSAFLEPSTREVEFPEYMTDSLDIVLKYMYTGSIKITVSNVLAVERVGSYLAINYLVDICKDFINRNLQLITKTEEFLTVDWIMLASILKSEKQQANEQCIWEAVMKWVKHDPENRSKVLPKLMEHVRFDLISPKYLWQNIAQDDLVKSSTECKDFIYEVLGNVCTQSADNGMNVNKSRYSVEDIYVIGGTRAGIGVINSVLKYNSQAGEWCLIEYMDKPLRFFGATVVDNKIYTVGGGIKSSIPDVEMFDTEVKKWSKVSQLNGRRRALGVCSVSNTIYACGGFSAKEYSTLKSVEFCDLGVGCWEITTPMNIKRGYVKVVCLEGTIWALGGQQGESIGPTSLTTEQYDPREGQWSLMSPMLTARNNHDAVVLDNKIYVCGDNSFEEYDPRNKKWRLLSPMLEKRSYPSSVVIGGKIRVIGGGNETVETYDRIKNEWTLETPLPWKLSENCAVVLPHSI